MDLGLVFGKEKSVPEKIINNPWRYKPLIVKIRQKLSKGTFKDHLIFSTSRNIAQNLCSSRK